MPENIQRCPLCGRTEHTVFEVTEFHGHEIINRVCQTCGFVFQSPSMTAAELSAFYTTEYRKIYQGEEGPNQKDLITQTGRAKALLAFAKETIPRVTRHLDIGCSAGILLGAFRDHYGSQPVGAEPGESYRRYARTQGLTVHADIGSVKSETGEGFDLVSLAHVLEHIPDPVAYLIEIREELLSDHGFLLIEVPNLYVHDSFEIAHMSSFSQHTLRQTLLKAGFEVVASMKHGKPRSELLPLYLTVIARPTTGGGVQHVKPEMLVRQKRNLGMFVRRVIQKLFPNRAWLPLLLGDTKGC
jgi:SAM-dependent methyltransferase